MSTGGRQAAGIAGNRPGTGREPGGEIPTLNPPRTRLLPPKLHKTGTVTGIFSVHPAAARSSMLSGQLKFPNRPDSNFTCRRRLRPAPTGLLSSCSSEREESDLAVDRNVTAAKGRRWITVVSSAAPIVIDHNAGGFVPDLDSELVDGASAVDR